MNFYFNYALEKKQLKKLFHWFHQKYGYTKTTELADTLKILGFHYATYAGISLGIDDLDIPPLKSQLVKNAEEQAAFSDYLFERGDITSIERFRKVIETWNWTSEKVKEEVLKHFRSYKKLNPVYIMAFSGARGNISQVRQLVGMRGLMSDSQGNLIDVPIEANFREGLTIIEYVISCYGARKGVVDTALNTATSGYLTRRLVEAAQVVIISAVDCNTEQGIFISDLFDEEQRLISSLQVRLSGRVLFETLWGTNQLEKHKHEITSLKNISDFGNEKLSKNQNKELFEYANSISLKPIGIKNQEIQPFQAEKIAKHYKRVCVRSPLSCGTLQSKVCQLCYGWDFSRNDFVSLGEAVGIIAAQSIGEPGTQLTMRTFHTGGVFTGDVGEKVVTPFDGRIHYSAGSKSLKDSGRKIRTGYGENAFFNFNNLYIAVIQENLSFFNQVSPKVSIYRFPKQSFIYVTPGEKVSHQQIIGEIPQQTFYSDEDTNDFKNYINFNYRDINDIYSFLNNSYKNVYDFYFRYGISLQNCFQFQGNYITNNFTKKIQLFSYLQGNKSHLHIKKTYGFPAIHPQKSSLFFTQKLKNSSFLLHTFKYVYNISLSKISGLLRYCLANFQNGVKHNLKSYESKDNVEKVEVVSEFSGQIFFKSTNFDQLVTNDFKMPFSFFNQLSSNFINKNYDQGSYEVENTMEAWLLAGKKINTNNSFLKGDKILCFSTQQSNSSDLLSFNSSSVNKFSYLELDNFNTNQVLLPNIKDHLRFSFNNKGRVCFEVRTSFITFDHFVNKTYGNWHLVRQDNCSLINSKQDSNFAIQSFYYNNINTVNLLKNCNCIKNSNHTSEMKKQNFAVSLNSSLRKPENGFKMNTTLGQQSLHSFSLENGKLYKAGKNFQDLSSNTLYSDNTYLFLDGEIQKRFNICIKHGVDSFSVKFSECFDSNCMFAPNFDHNNIQRIYSEIYLGKLLRKGDCPGFANSLFLIKNWSKNHCVLSDNENSLSCFSFINLIKKQMKIKESSLIIQIRATYSLSLYNLGYESSEFYNQFEIITRQIRPYLLSSGATTSLKQWQIIEPRESLFYLPYIKEKTGDIVQGLPKIEQFFEAKKKKSQTFLLKNPKTISMKSFFFFRKRGLSSFLSTFFTFRNVQNLCLHSIQRVYKLQGIFLLDKHIEIIVRRMTSYILILHPGDTSFLPGEIVDYHFFSSLFYRKKYYSSAFFNTKRPLSVNTKSIEKTKSTLVFLPYILGITKVNLMSYKSAFLSAASFQETRQVLLDSAFEGCTDYLDELKQPVMLGKCLPAGISLFYEN